MQQESSSSRSSSIARDWYHLGRVRTLDEVGALVDALTCREHQRLSGRASAGQFHDRHLGIPSRWRCPLEFLEHKLPNGLEVDRRSATAKPTRRPLGFFVETGARDETDAWPG